MLGVFLVVPLNFLGVLIEMMWLRWVMLWMWSYSLFWFFWGLAAGQCWDPLFFLWLLSAVCVFVFLKVRGRCYPSFCIDVVGLIVWFLVLRRRYPEWQLFACNCPMKPVYWILADRGVVHCSVCGQRVGVWIFCYGLSLCQWDLM